MASRAMLLLSAAALVALIFLESRSLTSLSSSRFFTPKPLSSPMHAAATARAPNVERFAGWTDSPTLATHRPEESPGLGRWGGASLAAATVALALCRIATPVATCGTDAHDFDESGLPAGWDQDMDSIRDHLEASMGIGEAQYYADSDMPSMWSLPEFSSS